MVRWIMQPGNFTDLDFRFRRVERQGATKRIVHVDFTRPDDKAKVYGTAKYLAM